MDTKKMQSGRSMVEMMGYLMVAMGAIIAIGRIVSNAFDTHKYSTASLQLTELVGAMVKSSAIDVDYDEVVKKVHCQQKSTCDDAAFQETRDMIPNTFRVVKGTNDVTIYHAFGGTVDINIYGDDTEKFFIKYNNLSKRQCIELAMKDWRKNQYADLFATVVNNTSWWYWRAYGTKDGAAVSLQEGKCENNICVLPVSRVRLTGAGGSSKGQCEDKNTNTVMWIFN